ncbi:hypothetical protein QP157_06660 [Sphingomonas sp. LR61]|uniref:hypothetical protein n=1 Tax=Sphingomonas sp. LR61 TaxID=3050234 RepID=UPI002FE39C87
MAASKYEGMSGVNPIRVQTLRGLRRRAKRGEYVHQDSSMFRDFFTDLTPPTDRAAVAPMASPTVDRGDHAERTAAVEPTT